MRQRCPNCGDIVDTPGTCSSICTYEMIEKEKDKFSYLEDKDDREETY